MDAPMKASLRVQAALSQPGSSNTVNEDAWGHAENVAWVIDGATGVEADTICPERSDAAWFAGEVSNQLGSVWQGPQSVVDGLKAALSAVRNATVLQTPRMLRGSLGPTASIAIARCLPDEIEIGILGDCRVIEVRDDGSVISHGSSDIYRLDRDLIETVDQIKRSDISEHDKAKAIAKLEFELRTLANCDRGYWILDLSGAGIEFMEIIRLSAPRVAALILVTDGIYRLIDTYCEFDDSSFAKDVLRLGPTAIFERLRAIEGSDPHCCLYKRIKAQDDATLLTLSRSTTRTDLGETQPQRAVKPPRSSGLP